MQPSLFTKRVAAIPNIVLAPLLMTCVSVLPRLLKIIIIIIIIIIIMMGGGGVGGGVIYQANVRD